MCVRNVYNVVRGEKHVNIIFVYLLFPGMKRNGDIARLKIPNWVKCTLMVLMS